MTRRRDTRRRHRTERRQREPGAAPVAPEPPSPETKPVIRDISLMGVAGGLSGMLPMATIAVLILIDPGQASRLWAIGFFVGALFFVPVTVASVVPNQRRQAVQKGAVFACMAIAAVSAVFLDIGLAVLLAIPTTLLAVASGIIFQPSARGR